MVVYTVVNHKGGVGKTVTATSFAAAAAENGKNVILIDADPQGSATSVFLTKEPTSDIVDGLRGEPIAKVLQSTTVPGLKIVGATARLATIFTKIDKTTSQHLRNFCLSIADVDVIVIDCGPAITPLTSAVVSAADEVIIPTTLGKFSLDGIAKTMKTIEEARRLSPHKIYVNGVLLVQTTLLGKTSKYFKYLRSILKNAVYSTDIPKARVVSRAEFSNQTIFQFSPRSQVSKAYMNLFHEAQQRRQLRARTAFTAPE